MNACKKILIVSASIGSGHNQAANAIKTVWESKFLDDIIYIVDFMSDDNFSFNYLLKEIYLKSIHISPNIYEFLYRWTQDKKSIVKAQDTLSWAMQLSMMRLIKQYRPNLIICTHPFSCNAISYLKSNKELDIPVVGVVTDFSIHRFWISGQVNQYVVAAPEVKESLVKWGISPSSIAATGIPIHPSFSLPVAEDARPTAFSKTTPILLIMGGGLGLGPLQELLAIFNNVVLPIQVIIVTGNNNDLRDKLQSLTAKCAPRIKVLGYVKHIRELMAAADILITKPGGLTICEALAMELPMLFYECILGQELDNARFIINKGAACWLGDCDDKWEMDGDKIDRQLTTLLTNPGKLIAMKNAAKLIGRPQAALAAVEAINSQLLDRSC